MRRRVALALFAAALVLTTLAALDSDSRLSITSEDRAAILALGEQLQQVWRSESCPMELKKKILRTIVEEVIVDLDDDTQTLTFAIHWHGVAHTSFEMPKPSTCTTAPERPSG